MMMHLEIMVDDLESAVVHAVALGATVADFQPQTDDEPTGESETAT
jgi:hypothetical protein